MISGETLSELRAVLAALPSAVCVIDPNLTCLAMNERFANLIALPTGGLTILPLRGHAPAVLTEVITAAFDTLRRAGTAQPSEIEIDGATFLADFGPIGPPAAPRALCVTLSDISHLSRANRQTLETNRDLREALRRATHTAETDSLTDLPNRHAFENALIREIRRSRQHGTMLAVALIDIDHFKTYNDTYGHILGDDCLSSVARALAQALPEPTDFIARFGGEEFVCILPDTSHDAAAVLISRLAGAVSDLRLEHAASPHRVVTVSIGAFALGIANDDVSEAQLRHTLLQKADDALYAAKEAGRDTSLIADADGRITICRQPASRDAAQAPSSAGTQAAKPEIPFADTVRAVSRRHFSADEKLQIVLAGLHDEAAAAELCRREGIPPALLAAWQANFVEAGRARLSNEAAELSQQAAPAAATSPGSSPADADTAIMKDIIVDLLIDLRRLRPGGAR